MLSWQGRLPEAAQHDGLGAQADLLLISQLARGRVELPVEQLAVSQRAQQVGDVLKDCQKHGTRDDLPSKLLRPQGAEVWQRQDVYLQQTGQPLLTAASVTCCQCLDICAQEADVASHSLLQNFLRTTLSEISRKKWDVNNTSMMTWYTCQVILPLAAQNASAVKSLKREHDRHQGVTCLHVPRAHSCYLGALSVIQGCDIYT